MPDDAWTGYDEEGRCKKCHRPRTSKGQDPCIADLPGVKSACCGHGGPGYIALCDGRTYYFDKLERR